MQEYRARPEDGFDLPPLPPTWEDRAIVVVPMEVYGGEYEMSEILKAGGWMIVGREVENGEIRLMVENSRTDKATGG